MDGEEKPELEEEVDEGEPTDESMEAIPRGCLLTIWWVTLILVLATLVKFVFDRLWGR